jgi:hypothetical protein
MKLKQFVFTCIFISHAAFADDLIFCDGKWTNLPCANGRVEGATGKVLPEQLDEIKSQETKSQAIVERNEKKSLFQDLSIFASKARREYGVRSSLNDIERICLMDETSVTHCREIIAQEEDRISTRTAEVKNEKRAVEDQELKKKELELKAKEETKSTVIIVNQPRRSRRYRNPNDIYLDGDHHNHQIQVEQNSIGGGVNLPLNGNGSISIGGTSRSTTRTVIERTTMGQPVVQPTR